MTDSGVPVGTGSAPRPMAAAPTGASLYPGVSPEALRSVLEGAKADEPFHLEPLFVPRYARFGRSPIPYAAVSLSALVLAAWAHSWAAWNRTAPGRLRDSDWWVNVTNVLLPGEAHGPGAYSNVRMWWALGLMVFASLTVAAWIGRIGRNLRPEHSPFGSIVPIIAFPAWWILPLTLGGSVDVSRSRYDVMTRYLLAFGVLFAQFLLFRWPLLNRIWRAGHLPYDMASILLWLPNLVPWMMIFASNAYSFFQARNDTTLADSNWRPTPAMVDWALWTTRVSLVLIVVLLVGVSVRQHIGMSEDRSAEEAARQAA